MYRSTFTSRFSWIGLFLLIQACQPTLPDPMASTPVTPPGAPSARLRVKSITQELTANTTKVTTFSYDNQGRLSSLLAYQTPDSTVAAVERNTYQYDTQNRLIRQQRQLTTRPGSLFAPVASEHQFVYNTSGQVAEIRFASSSYMILPQTQTIIDLAVLNSPSALAYTVEPRYNVQGQVIGNRKAVYIQGQPSKFSFTSEYAYTGKNLTMVNTVSQSDNTLMSTDQNSLTYDDRTNPFYGLYVIPPYYGGISDYFMNVNTLSPNNLTRIGGVSYRYEYNTAGLPILRQTFTDKLVETLHLAYESF